MNYVLTFKQFLQNPTGPYSAYFGKRVEIINNLENRFSKLLSSRMKDFTCKLYKEKEDYYFHVTVPSETFKEITYDIVVKLTPSNDACKSESSLFNYKCQFFSNSPAFVFTYAYVFNKDGNLINFLSNKISAKALKEEPNIKNPVQIYGYEKSLYFAMLYIKYKFYHIKTNILSLQKTLNKKELLKNIDHSDKKLAEYQKYKKIEAINKKAEKEKEKQQKQKEKLKKQKEKERKNKKISNKVIKPKKKI